MSFQNITERELLLTLPPKSFQTLPSGNIVRRLKVLTYANLRRLMPRNRESKTPAENRFPYWLDRRRRGGDGPKNFGRVGGYRESVSQNICSPMVGRSPVRPFTCASGHLNGGSRARGFTGTAGRGAGGHRAGGRDRRPRAGGPVPGGHGGPQGGQAARPRARRAGTAGGPRHLGTAGGPRHLGTAAGNPRHLGGPPRA